MSRTRVLFRKQASCNVCFEQYSSLYCIGESRPKRIYMAPRAAATAHLCIVGEEGEVKGAGKTHSQPLCEAKLVKLLFFRQIILCRRLQVGENKVEQRRRSRPGTVLTRPRQGKSKKSVVAQLQPRWADIKTSTSSEFQRVVGSHRFVAANPQLALTPGQGQHLHFFKVDKVNLNEWILKTWEEYQTFGAPSPLEARAPLLPKSWHAAN